MFPQKKFHVNQKKKQNFKKLPPFHYQVYTGDLLECNLTLRYYVTVINGNTLSTQWNMMKKFFLSESINF